MSCAWSFATRNLPPGGRVGMWETCRRHPCGSSIHCWGSCGLPVASFSQQGARQDTDGVHGDAYTRKRPGEALADRSIGRQE